MVKKVIAGLLSTVMSAVLITANYDTVNQESSKTLKRTENTFTNDGMSISSSNSLGNYINNAMHNNELVKSMAYQPEANYDYNLGFAELDKGTGILTIYSSQPYDAKILILVKDEDSQEAVYTTELNVEKGENTVNTVNINVNSLPEFFYVELQLFDRCNRAVGQAYTLNTYTKFVQEIKANDIYDFGEKYVVNLDEDESTNFVVLNENTIKGESTEDKNILISADYHNDQYIFESIDDTIRYLDKGDKFFIRPTEDDIIALSVSDITINGDRAILTGDENTDGIFDVIKIETSADDVSNAVVDEDVPSDCLEYNGIVEDENGDNTIEYTFDCEFNKYKAKNLNYDGDKIELEYEFGDGDDDNDDDKVDLTKPDFSNKELKTTKRKMKVDGDITGKLKLAAGFEFQFYQKWLKVNFEIKFSPSFTFEVKCDGKIDIPIAGTTHPIGWVVVPGLWFGFKPELTFTLEGKIDYKKTLGYDYIWSFDSTRDWGEMFSYTCTPKEDSESKITVEADISITFNIQPMFYLFSDDVAAIILSMPIELGIECSTNNLLDDIVSRSQTTPQTLLFPSIMGYDEDTAHTCKLCYKLKPYLKIEIKFELEVKCVPFLDKFTRTIYKYNSKDAENSFMNRLKMYCSVTNGVTDFGDCPYKAYKTTFDLVGSKEIDESGAEVTVDGLKGITNNDGVINFYCENGIHSYTVAVDGELIKSETFVIDNAVKYIGISLAERKVNDSDGSKIVTTEPATGFDMPPHIEDIPERPEEINCIESGRLGDDIFYFIYKNGEMHIHGSGEMYIGLHNTINNKSAVKTVYFIDNDHENNEFITNIGNGLFYYAENLETVYLSNEITKIEKDAFNNCTNLKYFRYGGENDSSETLVLPQKLTYIGEAAFYNCINAAFEDLIIPEGVTFIGHRGFYNCSGIRSVKSTNKETIIGGSVFESCPNLEVAEFWNINGKFERYKSNSSYYLATFAKCPSLRKLVLPFIGYEKNVLYDGSLPQSFTLDLLFTPFKGDLDNSELFGSDRVPLSLKSITILDSTIIPDCAFTFLDMIEEIKLSNNTSYIGFNAFAGCTNAKIEFEGGFNNVLKNDGFDSINSGAFNGCSNTDFGDLIIPKNILNIKNGAFYQCNGITSLKIEGEMSEIEKNAFKSCIGLKEIELPPALEKICTSSFENCSALEKIYFNDKINHIEYSAFNGCGGADNIVDEINYEGTNEQWEILSKSIEPYNDPIIKCTNLHFNVDEPTKESETHIYGDTNGDGQIDMSDAVMIMQALANPNKYGINGTDPKHITAEGFKYGDADGNGLTVNDALRIQQYLLGHIDSLV